MYLPYIHYIKCICTFRDQNSWFCNDVKHWKVFGFFYISPSAMKDSHHSSIRMFDWKLNMTQKTMIQQSNKTTKTILKGKFPTTNQIPSMNSLTNPLQSSKLIKRCENEGKREGLRNDLLAKLLVLTSLHA